MGYDKLPSKNILESFSLLCFCFALYELDSHVIYLISWRHFWKGLGVWRLKRVENMNLNLKRSRESVFFKTNYCCGEGGDCYGGHILDLGEK